MRIFIITGEASGDLYGAHLIRELKRINPQIEICAWGGDKMQATGAEVVKHIRELAYMGLWEVIANLPKIIANLKVCKQQITSFQPDRIVYIDYPGFNMRIGAWAKKRSFRNIYYIAPQVWAWHPGRIKFLVRDFDKIITVLPVAHEFFKNNRAESYFAGHPLCEIVKEFTPDAGFRSRNNLDNRPIVAVFPGSRAQEIKKCLPVMLSVVGHFPAFQFCISQMEHIPEHLYRKAIMANRLENHQVRFIKGQNYDLLSRASKAVITSGTASLEAALFSVPHVVCYKTSPITYMAGKYILNVPYLSLVNILCGQEVVKELIQHELNRDNLIAAFNDLKDIERTQSMKIQFQRLRELLGTGNASAHAAKLILED